MFEFVYGFFNALGEVSIVFSVVLMICFVSLFFFFNNLLAEELEDLFVIVAKLLLPFAGGGIYLGYITEGIITAIGSGFITFVTVLSMPVVAIVCGLAVYKLLDRVRFLVSRYVWDTWADAHKGLIELLPDEVNPLEEAVVFKFTLNFPDPLRDIIVANYGMWLLENPYPSKATIKEVWEKTPPLERHTLLPRYVETRKHAECINQLVSTIPAPGLLTKGDTPLWNYFYPTLRNAVHDDTAHGHLMRFMELGEYGKVFQTITVGLEIPEKMRTEHMQVLANPGHGKSTLLTELFFDDLKKDAGIVVIDSQGDLINDLATRVPRDRLILIDPMTCPPALNIFATKIEGEQGIANALALFEYIFASLGVTMTGKQEMVYRYLSRLCMLIPNGSIETLRDLLLPGGTEEYQDIINGMNDNAQAFFRQYQQPKNNQFGDTRQEVLTRLLKVLESDTFSLMLGASTMRLDIPQALAEGKVILVSTAKNFLDKGAALLGRIFVAQVMQAVRNRAPGDRKRVYLYIDEFADYAEDSNILLDCFAQGRKYELGMIVAHQNFDQLTPKLQATMSSSTAIKFAGGLSAEDSRRMASQMRVHVNTLDAQPKGTFLAHFKDIGAIPWPVQLGFITTIPEVNNLADVQANMRKRYGAEKRSSYRPPAPDRQEPDAW